jgi:hypothetical protein
MANDPEVTGVTILDKKRLSHVGPVPIGGGNYRRELVAHRIRTAMDRGDGAMQEFTEACSASGVRHRVLREVGGQVQDE